MNGEAFTTATTPAVDQRLGGGPVEVEVVDDRDVAGLQPAHQRAGPAVDAGGAGHPGQAVDGEWREGNFMAEQS